MEILKGLVYFGGIDQHTVVVREVERVMEVVSFGGTDLCLENVKVLLMDL